MCSKFVPNKNIMPARKPTRHTTSIPPAHLYQASSALAGSLAKRTSSLVPVCLLRAAVCLCVCCVWNAECRVQTAVKLLWRFFGFLVFGVSEVLACVGGGPVGFGVLYKIKIRRRNLDEDPWLSDRNLTVPSNEKKRLYPADLYLCIISYHLIVSELLLYRVPHTYTYWHTAHTTSATLMLLLL